MADWNVGPGVAEAIANDGGEPRSDERFIILDEGHKVSMTFATTGVYYWYQEDNRTFRSPFDQAAPAEPSILWDPWASMPGQLYDWTCAACSLEWVKRSTGLIYPWDVYVSREQTVYEIGYRDNINETYGLMSSDGSALRAVLRDIYGQDSEQGWLDFDTTYELATRTTGMLSGAAWYHWTAIRGVQGDTIWIANSAEGYKSVWSNLSRSDWNRLGGFSVVWLV